MECPSCDARSPGARFCGRCGELLPAPRDAAVAAAGPPRDGSSEVGHAGVPGSRRLLGLGLALAAVVVGGWLVAVPSAENEVDLPAVAAGEPDRDSAPTTDDRREYVEFARVIDCSPALEEIGETIVRQMRRAKLVERHGNQLCLVLTDEVPTRPAATKGALKAPIASARFPRADDCAADLDGIAVDTAPHARRATVLARRGVRPCFVLDTTSHASIETPRRLTRRSMLR